MMKRLSLLVGLMLVAGCFGGYSPQNRFYTLQSFDVAETQTINIKNISVGIGTVSLPDYLDKPQIVVMEADSPQVKMVEHDRWSDDLSSMIQRTLADDIAYYLPKSIVKSKIELAENFDFLIDVQIVKMDFIWNEKAVLEAWWYINDANGKTIKQHKFYAKESVGNNFGDFVQDESSMLSKMSQDVAIALAKIQK